MFFSAILFIFYLCVLQRISLKYIFVFYLQLLSKLLLPFSKQYTKAQGINVVRLNRFHKNRINILIGVL